MKFVRDMALTLELSNGSRIIALCGEGDNFRGFSSPRLCVVDEASIVSDTVLNALLPMLIVSDGRLIALSTPRGKRDGFMSSTYVKTPIGKNTMPALPTVPAFPRNGLKSNADRSENGSTPRVSERVHRSEGHIFVMRPYKPSSTIPTVKACSPR